MPTPDLSIILANYNHARLLPRALDAILTQSVRPREIVLLDDCSTDDSMTVLESYARREPTIRVYRNEQNLGVCASYNKGLALASTKWSLLAAADDYLLPGFLEKATAELERHPHAGLCFAYDSFQEGDGPIWPNASGWTDTPGYFTPDDVCRLLRHCLPGHATVIRRQALIDAGGYRPELAWYSDWFALLTVAFRHGVCHVPETLAMRVIMLPGAYSAGAKQGPRNVAVLAAFLDHMTSPQYADVAPYFRRNGAATYFGTDLIRAAAPRPDRWEPHVLGFLNGFTTEQYEELLTDPDPAVRELGGFFLGPFWRESIARRKELESEIERLRQELGSARQRIPPPGAVGKLRWLVGLVTKRLRRAPSPGSAAGTAAPGSHRSGRDGRAPRRISGLISSEPPRHNTALARAVGPATEGDTMTATARLDDRSKHLRRVIVRMLQSARRGHVGSAYSVLEILRVLYDDVLRYDPANPRWPARDRCILSKGHGCLALYAVLADKGFFPESELWKFCAADGILGGHPDAEKVPGVEASTGALGHGLPIGLGMAIHLRMIGSESRVFVILGDGECNEGSVWEAAMCAGKHRLSNLTVIVDYNKHQSYGSTREVQDLEPFADKWRAFGFAVREVDGHDVSGLRETLRGTPIPADRPTAVIAHTVKGKGVSFAENNMKWHHKNKVTDQEVEALLAAIGGT